MKQKIQWLILLVAVGFVMQCKTKEEPSPVIKVTITSDVINEGDTLIFVNATNNVSKHEWRCDSLQWTSSEASPSLILTKAGIFDFTYKAINGDGQSDDKKFNITVLPDSIYRLSSNGKKVWIVKSITYGGSEMLTNTCQKDTCTLTQGKDTCTPGTYIFTLPATSSWRWVSAKKAFEFSLVAFGSPVNLSFTTTELTSTTFKGIDAVNAVSIHMERKP
jgi:hypothetical protein